MSTKDTGLFPTRAGGQWRVDVLQAFGVVAALAWMSAGIAIVLFGPWEAPMTTPGVALLTLASIFIPALALIAVGFGAAAAERANIRARFLAAGLERLARPETTRALDAASLERWTARQIEELNTALAQTADQLSKLDEAIQSGKAGLTATRDEVERASQTATGDLGTVQNAMTQAAEVAKQQSEATREDLKRQRAALTEELERVNQQLANSTKQLDQAGQRFSKTAHEGLEHLNTLESGTESVTERLQSSANAMISAAETLYSGFDARTTALLTAADRVDDHRRTLDDTMQRSQAALDTTTGSLHQAAETLSSTVARSQADLDQQIERLTAEADTARKRIEEGAGLIREATDTLRHDSEASLGEARQIADKARTSLTTTVQALKTLRDTTRAALKDLHKRGDQQVDALIKTVETRFAKSQEMAEAALKRVEALDQTAEKRLHEAAQRYDEARRVIQKSEEQLKAARQWTLRQSVEEEPYPGVWVRAEPASQAQTPETTPERPGEAPKLFGFLRKTRSDGNKGATGDQKALRQDQARKAATSTAKTSGVQSRGDLAALAERIETALENAKAEETPDGDRVESASEPEGTQTLSSGNPTSDATAPLPASLEAARRSLAENAHLRADMEAFLEAYDALHPHFADDLSDEPASPDADKPREAKLYDFVKSALSLPRQPGA